GLGQQAPSVQQGTKLPQPLLQTPLTQRLQLPQSLSRAQPHWPVAGLQVVPDGQVLAAQAPSVQTSQASQSVWFTQHSPRVWAETPPDERFDFGAGQVQVPLMQVTSKLKPMSWQFTHTPPSAPH